MFDKLSYYINELYLLLRQMNHLQHYISNNEI